MNTLKKEQTETFEDLDFKIKSGIAEIYINRKIISISKKYYDLDINNSEEVKKMNNELKEFGNNVLEDYSFDFGKSGIDVETHELQKNKAMKQTGKKLKKMKSLLTEEEFEEYVSTLKNYKLKFLCERFREEGISEEEYLNLLINL